MGVFPKAADSNLIHLFSRLYFPHVNINELSDIFIFLTIRHDRPPLLKHRLFILILLLLLLNQLIYQLQLCATSFLHPRDGLQLVLELLTGAFLEVLDDSEGVGGEWAFFAVEYAVEVGQGDCGVVEQLLRGQLND